MHPPAPSLRRLYWILQVAGWATWCTFGLVIVRAQYGAIDPAVLIGYVLFFGYSIALTHLLRAVIHRGGWLALEPLQAIGRLAASALLTSLLLAVLVALVSFALAGGQSAFAHPTRIAALWLNLTLATIIWVTLYAGIGSWLRSRQARQQAEALERSLAGARLHALEAQMNPHFLFNSLNSLRGMIAENPAHAQDMVTRLANILRHNLTRGAGTTTEPLAEQLEVVADYLELESVRFDERLRPRFNIAPETLACAVPSMLLQTLVENALKHGIAHLPEGGEVLIASRLDAGTLEILVENTGTLRPAPAESTQVGLANARERLRMLYGTQASLELSAISPARVQARLRLPAVSYPPNQSTGSPPPSL